MLINELAFAIRVSEAAMGTDRLEYQTMLRNSFDGMIERLQVFFSGEKVNII